MIVDLTTPKGQEYLNQAIDAATKLMSRVNAEEVRELRPEDLGLSDYYLQPDSNVDAGSTGYETISRKVENRSGIVIYGIAYPGASSNSRIRYVEIYVGTTMIAKYPILHVESFRSKEGVWKPISFEQSDDVTIKVLFENLDSAAAHTPAEMRLQAYFLGYAVGPAGFKTASKE